MAVGESQLRQGKNEWLKLAAKRLMSPTDYLTLDYQADADLLVIRYNKRRINLQQKRLSKGRDL